MTLHLNINCFFAVISAVNDDETYTYKSTDSSSSDDDGVPEFNKSKKVSVRIPWTEEDLKMLAKTFQGLKKPPNNEAVRKFKLAYPPVKDRTIAQIKTRAWCLISKGN